MNTAVAICNSNDGITAETILLRFGKTNFTYAKLKRGI